MRLRGSRPTGLSEVLQLFAIAALAALTVLLCVLAIKHTNSPPPIAENLSNAPTAAPASPPANPDTTANQSAAPQERPPHVRDQRRADFTAGDPLPDGSRIFDSSTVSGMVLRDGVLTHGGAAGTAAASYLETRLAVPVTKLGARMVFAAGSSGSVALVASKSSIVEAGRAHAPLPQSGLRLVVSPGSWKLVSGTQRQQIAAGEFTMPPGAPVTIEVVRQGSTLWITGPGSAVTKVEDPHAAEMTGPWACWGLLETSPDQQPASIQAVWAG